MKWIFTLFIFFVSGFYIFANDYDFSALHGLRDENGNIYFEISGYEIFCSSVKGKLNDPKTLEKFKNEQKIKDIQADYSDPKLIFPNQIIETEQVLEKNPVLKYSQVFYLFPQSDNEIKYLVFQTLNQRDILLERDFINAFLEEKLERYISDDWITNSISFLGRSVQLGTACQWIAPHNLSGSGGQIIWSEFLSAESAEFDLDTRIAADSESSFAILSEDNIDILFEGVPTIAYRVVYMEKIAYNPLIVYYIAQAVRDRYVSCTMSNYGINRNDCKLSPLLQQFMSIPDLPDWAKNKLDTPQYEDSANDMESFYPDWTPNFEFRLGSVFPLGRLNNIFRYAPSFDLFMCFPLKQKMSIDIGIFLSFPIGRNSFDFTYQGETFETKASPLVGASLRYRYQHTIRKDLSCYTYMGAGFSSLFTDLVKEINYNNEKIYHSIETFDLYGGIQLIYKRLGYFIEYHRTPFSNSSKVANNFGDSFLNTGFTYYLNLD